MTAGGVTVSALLSRASVLAFAVPAMMLAAAPGAHAQQATEIGTIGGTAGAATVLAFSTDLGNGESTRTNYSEAYGVSADGSVVVGAANTPNGFAHAFEWTQAGGISDLGALDSAAQASVALGVSGDGATVVGMSTTTAGDWQAFEWTAGKGMVDLGHLGTSAGNYSVAWGVNSDGSVIVGGSWTDTTIDRAFRWTAATGMVNLGLISGDGYSDALGVSGDGNTVVGVSTVAAGYLHAFRWTSAGGMADLGTIGGVTGGAAAIAANSDGTVVVGRSVFDSAGAFHAFRWTSAGMADLGTIGGVSGASTAFAVSGDGATVVGQSNYLAGGGANHAFLWNAGAGMRDLNTVLSSAGVNMTGVSLNAARGVSADGTVIVGSGTFSDTGMDGHAFVARVGPAFGVTTLDSLFASVLALADSQTAQILTNQVQTQVLLGQNEQISCGDCGGADASFGSFDVGAHGRVALTPEWTVLGGMSLGRNEEKGAEVTFVSTFAGAIRYDPAGIGPSRPYAEVGGAVSPWQETTYRRTYANGAGTADGVGATTSSDISAYARLGWVARITPRDEIAGSVGYARLWQIVAGYAEQTGNSNPFNAVLGNGTDILNVASLDAQYTHLFGRRIEADLNAGVDRSFSGQSGVAATVVGAGMVSGQQRDFTYYEVGGRIGVRLARRFTLDLFADASLAPRAIGSSVHGGLGFRADF
ncbi:MAG TPA: hypothetical protein VFC47_09490 [Caulobacteraceae bacterium]|nr:hypothetical protein [Caulobacteraceae bacterium]